jgi:cytosine/adenosine deaminase-related metal-dependent hydrolase
MVLKNIDIIGQRTAKHLRIAGHKIETITADEALLKIHKNEFEIDFNQAITFPGLINSHDHLEFNLFPQLANSTYRNYLDWGSDIHKKNKDAINSILKIPKYLRVEWGIYKNSLQGITTVVQHGEYFKLGNPLINIIQHSYSLHSVGLEKKWKYKLNRLFAKDQPFVIHIGEGTDTRAIEEINELIAWNLFKRKLIAVHGIAMNAEQAESFEALVWCPDSNLFLFNATAKVNDLKKKTKILFGTDSTLSANWNTWEQIRLAKKLDMLSDKEIFDSLTSTPAEVWGLNAGILEEGKNADVVVAKMKTDMNHMSSFFGISPEDILLILQNGRIILFDEVLYVQLSNNIDMSRFSKIFINKACKYIYGNLNQLIKEIRKYSTDAKFPIEIED